MEKEAKCTDCSKLRASSEATILASKSAETKLVSKAALRKKRKQKSKNVHLKAVTTKSHLELNTQGRSPSTRKSLKLKKQKTCNENLRDWNTAGKAGINGQKHSGTVDKVSLQSKVLLKAWPTWIYNSKKDCSEVIPKQNKLCNCQLSNKSIPSHSCFDFASGSTVRNCCLSSERGCWFSADPHSHSHTKHKRVNPRIVDQKEIQEAPPKTVLAPSTSSETSGHLEIPGFYYDPDKKRYFKIVPSSNNCMSNVVTRERIAFDKNEKLRQEELKSLATTGQLIDPKHQTTVRKTANILTLLDRRKQEIITQEVSTYQLRRFCIAKLRPHAGKGSRFRDSPGVNIKKMRIHAKENQLLVCHSVDAETSISLMKINSFKVVPNRSGSEVDWSFAVDLEENCYDTYNFGTIRVFDLCFATAHSASDVLCCANDHSLNNSRILIFQCIRSPPYHSQLELMVSNQTEPYLMCCASTNDYFAVGTERSVFLGNYAKSNQMTQLYTSNNAVHALTFANTSSRVLFCAAKNGRILMYDELSRRKPVAYLAESGGYSFDLYMTKDDRYLLSAKSNEQQIEKWDLRQGRVVVDYPGHVSKCTRTPLVVDQREEFLSAVGSDSYTRIWDLKTGELMKVLPPPLPATKENIPSVCFVDLYGESRNNYPGLLLGMSDELHFYSL